MLIGITDKTPMTILWLCISILLPGTGAATRQQCQLLVWREDTHLWTAELNLSPSTAAFPLLRRRHSDLCSVWAQQSQVTPSDALQVHRDILHISTS